MNFKRIENHTMNVDDLKLFGKKISTVNVNFSSGIRSNSYCLHESGFKAGNYQSCS
jgi:hypothetical protein